MGAPSGHEPLVLLVEDDPTSYELLADFLAHCGYRVIGASDGLEAWRLAHDIGADIVLVDHDLPSMTGTELTRKLKTEPGTANLPVVLMTGHVEQRLLDLARRAGCDSFVRKPFSLDQIRGELERLLHDGARARPQPPPRILVVEDDANVREILRSMLEFAGYAVEEAGDGAAALAQLKASSRLPALILLDLRLPVMNGWQFIAMQQKDPDLAHVPIVVLTAAARRDAETLPATAVLEKPIDQRRLIEVLDKSISNATIPG